MLTNFEELRREAAQKGRKRVGIPWAMDKTAIMAAYKSWKLGISAPVLLGEKARIEELMKELEVEEMEAWIR